MSEAGTQYALLRVATAVRDLILLDFATQSIPVNAKSTGGATLVAFGLIHGALDKTAFELGKSFLEQNAALHHLSDKSFQLIFHSFVLSRAEPPGISYSRDML